MEVGCKKKLLQEDQQHQARHTRDALLWLIDYLNLTQIIKERSGSSPWTWPGSMFYAGQLYTTIGLTFKMIINNKNFIIQRLWFTSCTNS